MDPGQAAYLEATPAVPGDEDYEEDVAENGGLEDDADEDGNSYGPTGEAGVDMRQKLNPLDETEFQNRVAIAVQAAET
jgi:hypothetical protein